MLDATLSTNALGVQDSCDSLGGAELTGTLAHAIARYLDFRRHSLAPATVRSLRNTLTDLSRSAGPNLPITRLSERHITRWLASRDIRASSIRLRVGIVRNFTAWCARERLVKRDVGQYLVAPRAPQSLPREIERDTVTKIFDAAPDVRAELVLSLMVQEGLRRAEVCSLNVGEIDRDSKLMLVHGKNSKERWLPISDETWSIMHAYLRRHPATTGPLIRSYVEPAKGITPPHLGRLVAEWMRDAGVKETAFDGRSAHALRHTFAGAMLDEGADVRDVQEALGHADLSATYRYLKRRRAEGKLREVMGRRSYRL